MKEWLVVAVVILICVGLLGAMVVDGANGIWDTSACIQAGYLSHTKVGGANYCYRVQGTTGTMLRVDEVRKELK